VVKVLHLINTLSVGGAELHLLTLCRYLKRHGVDVVVACLREHIRGSRSLRADFEQTGIRVVDLRADSRYDLRFPLRVAHLLSREQPDLMHTHLPRADFAGAIAHRLRSSIPCVCSVHGVYSTHWSGKWTLPLLNQVWQRADAVIAISHAVNDWLVQERHVHAQKVTVIHYGIEAERFAPSESDFRKMRRLDGQAVIGSIGRLEPIIGFDCLIRAMPALHQQLPSASLLLAGHDPTGYGERLQELIDALGLQEHVRLVGFQRDVPFFLQAVDVFALASRSEGFGQVVIEAMAAAKPVVVSRIPPLTEIVIDRESGLLVHPDDPQAFASALAWLLSHREAAQQMGKRGQERVWQHFSAARMGKETQALYESLLDA
jgi:glycosyltransferase involved in cell wall biosynthesis